VYSQDQAGRGQAKYAWVWQECHQADLSGSDQAPSLAGPEFLDRWNERSVGDLADRIRDSMPPQDGQIGSLNAQTSADITAFLLRRRTISCRPGRVEGRPRRHEEHGDQAEVTTKERRTRVKGAHCRPSFMRSA
jgi:hypothetical protein